MGGLENSFGKDLLFAVFLRQIYVMIKLIFIVGYVRLCIAGEGGFVYFINLSGSDWKRTNQESSAMEQWGFPELIKDRDTKLVYIEFGNFQFLKVSYGRVDYELVGTGGKSFLILAHGRPNRLEAVYNMEIDGQTKGMSRELGWKHNGDTNFIIIGKYGRYTGTTLDGSNWMRNNMDTLGSRTLRQITIPGSHDAGMSRLNGHTVFGRYCNVLTQSHSFGEQLILGVRYFDIRPVIGNGGEYLTGHYTDIEGSWQGGNGQSIASIITDINVFTKDHNELILIKLSHSLNTDVGNDNYRKLYRAEWENLFKKLDTINFLYNNDISNVRLDQVQLSDYTNNGSKSSVVIIVDDPDSGVQLRSRLGKGYFMPYNLNIFDVYSNTNECLKMIDDQIEKMHEHSNKQYFLLSWTLTQSATQAVLCVPSVRDLADDANILLGNLLYSKVSASFFPNIILVDNVKDTDVASMALAISTKIM